MHSAAIILSVLAGSVLSTPHGHNHIHARQVEVVDVVDVYTTVTIGGEAPPPTHKPKPVYHAPAPEEKVAWPQHNNQQFDHPQQVAPSSTPPPPPPPPTSTAAPPPPPPASSKAAPAPSSAPASSSGNDYLDLHNKYRSNHGAVAMAWDSDLASKAQSEANGCPSNDVQSGSNWYGSSGSSSVESAVNAWYNEMADYASETNNYANNPPSGGPDTGHFSQMIWNASTSLGCAMASSCGAPWKTQVTCLYSPAGNMVFNGQPQYVENVFPPK